LCECVAIVWRWILSQRPITPSDLLGLVQEEAAAWLAGFIVGDGSVCYSSRPKDGRRCFEARVRIGIFEIEPIEKAARLMGVKAFTTRLGRHEADASGTRATSVISRILPHLVGRKAREANFILEHGLVSLWKCICSTERCFGTVGGDRLRWQLLQTGTRSVKQMNRHSHQRPAPMLRRLRWKHILPNVARLTGPSSRPESIVAFRGSVPGKWFPLVTDRGFEIAR